MEITPAVPRTETSLPPAKPATIALPPEENPPMAWRVERASARFLPQWRIRHDTRAFSDEAGTASRDGISASFTNGSRRSQFGAPGK